MKNRFICSSRCQGLTLLIVLSVLAEPRALFDKRQEPPHCAMAALEEQKVPDAPIQRTPAEDAADLTTLLQKVNPTVDDTIRAAELCTSQLTNLAEFVNAFAGPATVFLFRARRTLENPEAERARKDWTFLGGLLKIDVSICKAPAVEQREMLRPAAKTAPEAVPSYGKFLASLRAAGTSNAHYHELVGALSENSDTMTPIVAAKLAKGEWYCENDTTKPRSILEDLAAADEDNDDSRKLDAAWVSFAAALEQLAPPDAKSHAKMLAYAVLYDFIHPVRSSGVSQGKVYELMATSVIPHIKHRLLANSHNDGSEDAAQVQHLAEQLGVDTPELQAAKTWENLSSSLQLDTLAKRQLDKRARARAMPGQAQAAEPHEDEYSLILGLVGKCYLPHGWRNRLKSGGRCPVHTLAPGLCPKRSSCKMNHPSGEALTRAWDALTDEFPLSLLLAARDSITSAAAELAAMGVMAQPPMYASAKSGKNKNHGNNKGRQGGAAAGAKGSTPPAPKSA